MTDFVCPFCDRIAYNEYGLRLHVEKRHTVDSPFIAKVETPASIQTSEMRDSLPIRTRRHHEYFQCSYPDCGELILPVDLDEHIALHIATGYGSQSPKQQQTRQDFKLYDNNAARSQKSTGKAANKDDRPSLPPPSKERNLFGIAIGSSRGAEDGQHVECNNRFHDTSRKPGQLGPRELGPHAYEKAMPLSVRDRLVEDSLPHLSYHVTSGKLNRVVTIPNQTSGLIRLLADLSALDPKIESTYMCHSDVKHIGKIPCDGNFCGYWNIQMMVAHLQTIGTLSDKNGLPNVLDIQADIENAWDAGICAYGRVETGGIRGTRKWIGSQEALAYFRQIGIIVDAISFRHDGPQASKRSVTSLLDYVEAYFIGGIDAAKVYKNTYITPLAPIYFQRFGHSTTIVGLEKKKNGHRNLLVFDPSFPTSQPVKKLLSGKRTVSRPEALLDVYRRSDQSLTKWNEFEIVLPRPTHAVI